MKPLKQFSIPFTGLKIGKHQFEFEIDNSFFDAFEYSLVKKGALKVNVELDKQETMLILGYQIVGTIKLDCDKCLSEFDAAIDITERQIVKFAEADMENDDLEIIVINKKESSIDISEVLYEFITVSVPYIKICEQNGNGVQCDREMIERIENLASPSQKEEKTVNDDPRWDALRKLK